MEQVWDKMEKPVNILSRVMSDIWDGEVLRTLRGPSGLFFSNRPNGEVRLVFSLFVDWFNPFGNKASGKHVSLGAIYMVCLNPPPKIRFRVENVYLVGIIPGPGEPSLHQINHFIAPLVDEFRKLWNPGVFFTCTAGYKVGRLVRCALIPLVADVPALHKVAGFLGHGAKMFCSFCQLRSDDICNFSRMSWRRMSWADPIRHAIAWRNAVSKTAREALAKATGIRWSKLLDLEYWNPTLYAVLDSMHNMFLGEFQRHIRVIWGIESVKSSDLKVQKNQIAHTAEQQAEELQTVLAGLARDRTKAPSTRKGYVVAIAILNGVPVEKGSNKQEYWNALREWVCAVNI